MVRGVAKNAVILQSNGQKEFEQVIFIVPAGMPEDEIASPKQMLEIAGELAEKYQIKTAKPQKKSKMTGLLSGFVFGALLSAAAILACLYFYPGLLSFLGIS